MWGSCDLKSGQVLPIFGSLLGAPFGMPCVSGVGYLADDLAQLVDVTAETCEAACVDDVSCVLYTWHKGSSCTYDGLSCSSPVGCCWLRQSVAIGSPRPSVNKCTCSGYARAPFDYANESSMELFKPAAKPPKKAKNLLYLLVDDLRNDLTAYGKSNLTHHTPNTHSFARRATVFKNAYAQIAVCSPSRMSFLTGRRPDHSYVYNFVDHFRQADCGFNEGGVVYLGDEMRTEELRGCGEPSECGGGGQCCTLCSREKDCSRWMYNLTSAMCTLFSIVKGRSSAGDVVSGTRGNFLTHATWSTLPQHLKSHGWLVASSGKVFHSEEGGWASPADADNGPGMPPNNDPPSWSYGLSMLQLNDVAPMAWCDVNAEAGDEFDCPVEADADGLVREPERIPQLCDRIIVDDARVKLRLLVATKEATGQPWMLAVGFRKPHLPYRFPKPFLDVLPPVDETDVALHPTLDASVPPIAHASQCGPAHGPENMPHSPYVGVPRETAQRWRAYYRASVAWVDSLVGRVLDELKTSGQELSTMVVLHSDHGYALGERGSWEKMSNEENTVRVPLMIAVPWMRTSKGRASEATVELIDIFPTVVAVLNTGRPEGLDGNSLVPAMTRPAAEVDHNGTYALSQFPRCVAPWAQPGDFWSQNNCMQQDRALFSHMGYSIRTRTWRFTEWYAWDGAGLKAEWSKVAGTELYSHAGNDGSDFDAFENVNQAGDFPKVVSDLREALRFLVDNQHLARHTAQHAAERLERVRGSVNASEAPHRRPKPVFVGPEHGAMRLDRRSGATNFSEAARPRRTKAEDGAAKKKPAAQRGRGGGGHLGPSREIE